MEPCGRAVSSRDDLGGLHLLLGRGHHLCPGGDHPAPPLLPPLAPGRPQTGGTSGPEETKFDESGSVHEE